MRVQPCAWCGVRVDFATLRGVCALCALRVPCVSMQVVNERTATADVFQSADAVLITVRADAPQPFAGVYQRMEALKCRYRPAAGVAGKGKHGLVAAPHALPTTSPRKRACPMPSPGRVNTLRSMVSSRSSMDAAGALTTEGDDASSECHSHSSACPPFSWTQGEEAPGGVGASPAACCTSPLRDRAPASFQSLALNTAPTGEAPFAKRASKRPRRLSVHEEDIPVAVAVTACDVIDTEAYCTAHPGRRDLLRLMATNWATAHRSCVTFVSSKSGVGVYTAVSNLVAHVLSRRAALRQVRKK